MHRFALDLPADPSKVSMVRIFVGAVARCHDVEHHLTDDLRLGVSEAFSMLVDGAERISCAVEGPPLRVTVAASGRGTPIDGDGWAIRVLRALFPDAELSATTITFSAR